MLEEDRINDTYKWEDFHLWNAGAFKHNDLGEEDIRELYDYAHEQLRDINGPQALQFMENSLDSHLTYKERTESRNDDYLSFQGKLAQARATGTSAYLRAVRLHHSSETVRERARMLENRYQDEIGALPVFYKLVSYFLSRNIKKKKEAGPSPVISDPPPRWSYYNTFDDGRVWVKKGRDKKKPVPYEDRRSAALTFAKLIRSR